MKHSVKIANEVLADQVNISLSDHRAEALLAMLETAGYHKYPEGSTALETYKAIKTKIENARPRHYSV